MVDRIEKTERVDYWKVSGTRQTQEEKKRDQGQSGQEQRDTFGETSDFIHLLAKDPRKFSSEKIAAAHIQGLTFRGVSTHREKAILEVDISMANGTLLRGAQIAVSRAEGMKYLSRWSGEEIVVDQIVKGTFLTVALPQKETMPPKEEHSTNFALNQAKPRIRFSWSYLLGFGALLIALVLLIYIFLTV